MEVLPDSALKASRAALRSSLRADLSALSPEACLESSRQLCEHLKALPELRAASSVALYSAMPQEASLEPLYPWLRAGNRRLYLPRILPEFGLEFCLWRAEDVLKPHIYGMLEPAAGSEVATPASLDVILVPGLGFDRQGGRMGHGAGYYDRVLPRFRARTRFIAVGFACQVRSEIPLQPWDVRMDKLVTELGVVFPCPTDRPSNLG
jgi:5-formyltetrahydrofolate cyclo-ligase